MEVFVDNNSDHEYVEHFDEREIRIPPRGFIKMGRSEANRFLGVFTEPTRDNNDKPLHPKPLSMRFDPEVYAAHNDQPLRFTCRQCVAKTRTKEGMDAHIKENHVIAGGTQNVSGKTI